MIADNDGTSRRYFGKYRGTVVKNADPQSRGRLRLSVSDVLSEETSTWAEPSVPLAGAAGTAMGVYMVPQEGAGVWVEFEQGDPDLPVWSGCRWGAPEDLPQQSQEGDPSNPNIVIQSPQGNMFMISDMAASQTTGGIILKSAGGAMIVVNDSGIYITNGNGASITLVGQKVDINNNALTVM